MKYLQTTLSKGVIIHPSIGDERSAHKSFCPSEFQSSHAME